MKFFVYYSLALLLYIVLSKDEQLTQLPYDAKNRDMSAVHPGRMDGKVCLITGATSGLGLDAALHLIAEGCKVVFTGRREEKGKAVEAFLKSKGGDAMYVKADVTKPSDCKMMVEKTVEKYGRLDASFNNAGTSSLTGKIHETDETAFSRIMDVNLFGVFYSMKYEIIQMLKNGGGSIVNCGSIYGRSVLPGTSVHYTTSKHALHGLTKTSALDYATSNIRTNIVSPAWTASELTEKAHGGNQKFIDWVASFHPQGRWVKPEEVSSTVAWLLSTDSMFVNGEDIEVSSGLTKGHIPLKAWYKGLVDISSEIVEKKEDLPRATEVDTEEDTCEESG